ncbi:hypothetical protein BC830DRAFT_320641 [Chytriomyces sp. MP71]|nr:hypothetical protein BC830DRAFT_320641 [Chytriomyces sp. MP71]
MFAGSQCVVTKKRCWRFSTASHAGTADGGNHPLWRHCGHPAFHRHRLEEARPTTTVALRSSNSSLSRTRAKPWTSCIVRATGTEATIYCYRGATSEGGLDFLRRSPKVFFEVDICGQRVGRIVMELRADILSKIVLYWCRAPKTRTI